MPQAPYGSPRGFIAGSLLLVASAASLGVTAKTAPKRPSPRTSSAAAIAAAWKAPPLADPESAFAYPAAPSLWSGFPMLPDGRFPIAAYGGPIPVQTADFRYAEFAGCGFTINLKLTEDPGSVESNLERLKIGARHNLWTFVVDNRIVVPGRAYAPGWRATLDSMVATYGKEPGFLGYFLADEPEPKQFSNFGAINQYLARRDRGHPGFVDLTAFAGPGHSYGRVPYSNYLLRYIEKARPALFAVDSYPLHQGSDSPYYVTGWDSVGYVSRTTGVPFWAVLLCSPYLDHRLATVSELAWQANLPMAYGARGIVWFAYWMPKPTDPKRFHDGPITYDGRRTATYARLQDLNTRLQVLGQEIGHMQWLGARQVGTVPAGCQAFRSEPLLAIDSKTPVTVGFFRQMSGTIYGLFVNRDYKKMATVGIVTPDTLLRWTRAPGLYRSLSTQPATNGNVRNELILAPGEAELVRLPRTFDFSKTQS